MQVNRVGNFQQFNLRSEIGELKLEHILDFLGPKDFFWVSHFSELKTPPWWIHFFFFRSMFLKVLLRGSVYQTLWTLEFIFRPHPQKF